MAMIRGGGMVVGALDLGLWTWGFGLGASLLDGLGFQIISDLSSETEI